MSKASPMAEVPSLQSVEQVGVAGDEKQLVARAAGGSMDAFRSIYEGHVEQVSRTVRRVLGPRAEVEDAVQEVFVTVHRNLKGFRGECRLSTWLYRIAFRVALNQRRARPGPFPLEDWRALRAEPRIFGRLEARERVRALHAALEKVAPEAKEAFLLFETEGPKLREISELTGEPLATITARVRRTREHLREVLDSMEREAHDD
ncbi:MAG: RNA polymerase sigma factor [Myxococcota bacterium]